MRKRRLAAYELRVAALRIRIEALHAARPDWESYAETSKALDSLVRLITDQRKSKHAVPAILGNMAIKLLLKLATNTVTAAEENYQRHTQPVTEG